MAMKPADVRNLVHTPAELSDAFVKWAERIQANPGIPFGVQAVDKVVIPFRPGDLIGIVARPGHGKSSLMAYLAREEAERIKERGAAGTEAVVYCTWESAVEELENFFQADDKYSATDIAWGRADLETVRARAIKRVSLPIWVIGHGIGRAGKKMPRMTPEVILGAIETMQQDFGVKPTLMLFDYLQLIPVKHARDRVHQVTEVPIRVKEVGLRIGAPAVVGIQAGRSVDKRAIPIPEMADCQWGSSAEQASDKLFAAWRPCQSLDDGTPIEIGDEKFTVNDKLLILRMLKQRGDRGRYTWGMYFDPALLKLAELETRNNGKDPWWTGDR